MTIIMMIMSELSATYDVFSWQYSRAIICMQIADKLPQLTHRASKN